MPSYGGLAPQFAALVVVLSVPVIFGYLGAKYTALLVAAFRRNELRRFWRREKRLLVLVGHTNLVFALLFVYGWQWEARWVERVDVHLPAAIPGPVRIVHLSDLHLEGFGEREEVALELVRLARPDLILLTGDYVSKGTGLAHAKDIRRFFSELEAPYGIFAVPGNWDLDMAALVEGSAVRPLAGRPVRIEVRSMKVAITGTPFDVPPPPPGDDTDLTIFLQHSPDFLAEASEAGYDLYLAGHTHGGQVRLPGFGAVVTLSRFWKRYEAGLYREGGTYLYVNRGLGLEGGWAPRVRLFCRPEVTVIAVYPCRDAAEEARGGCRDGRI